MIVGIYYEKSIKIFLKCTSYFRKYLAGVLFNNAFFKTSILVFLGGESAKITWQLNS